MLYQEKYTKYKNKYLDLKSKYGHLLNTTPQKTQLSNITHSKILLDLDESEHQKNLVNPKIINLTGGTNLTSLKFDSKSESNQVSESNQESETTTTLNNLTSSESISSLFKQNGGAKGKKGPKKSKVNKGVKHFFQDKSTSDSSLSSDTSTLSEVQSDSDFSSSELQW